MPFTSGIGRLRFLVWCLLAVQHSPNSGSSAREQAPQGIGSYSNLTLPGVKHLQFIEWPVMIGIDEMVIDRTPPPPSPPSVPEPGGIILLGSGFLLMFSGLRRTLVRLRLAL